MRTSITGFVVSPNTVSFAFVVEATSHNTLFINIIYTIASFNPEHTYTYNEKIYDCET